jgi:hypothetical protein
MIKHSKLPENIQELLPQAENYLNSHPDVLFAYLFGSIAGGTEGPLSDIDIAVFLSEIADFRKSKAEILSGLIDILRTDEIDLVILNMASLPLRMRVLEKGKLRVDKKPFQRHKYESLTMREYLDFAIFEMSIFKRRYLGD